MSWLVVVKGKGVDVRWDDGEDNTGKGFSLQQTEFTLIDGCWKVKMFGSHSNKKDENKLKSKNNKKHKQYNLSKKNN